MTRHELTDAGPTFAGLLQLARERMEQYKTSAVDAQTLMGGGGDPAAMAGGDPAAMGGGDPMAAAGGGDPMAAAGGGGGDVAALQSRLAMLEQQIAAGGGGGAAGGGVEPIKPKIDVNVTLLQMLKILAKIADAVGVQLSAAEMVATQEDLTNFAMNQSSGAGVGAGGGAAGATGKSAISPPSPIQGASPGLAKGAHILGSAYEVNSKTMSEMGDRAAALAAMFAMRN